MLPALPSVTWRHCPWARWDSHPQPGPHNTPAWLRTEAAWRGRVEAAARWRQASAPLLRWGWTGAAPPQRSSQSSAGTRGAPPLCLDSGVCPARLHQGRRQPGFCANCALLPALRPGWARERGLRCQLCVQGGQEVGSVLLHPHGPQRWGFTGRAARSPAQTGPGAVSLAGRHALCLLHPIRSRVTRPPGLQLWRVCGLCPPRCGLT